MEAPELRRSHIMNLETDYVHSAYDNIAPHLCHTKHKAWPRVEKFLQDLPPGALVADVGCGSGRYLDINLTTFTLGSDRCYRFVQASTHKLSGTRDVMVCDNLHLPYRTGLFDAVISIEYEMVSTIVERCGKLVGRGLVTLDDTLDQCSLADLRGNTDQACQPSAGNQEKVMEWNFHFLSRGEFKDIKEFQRICNGKLSRKSQEIPESAAPSHRLRVSKFSRALGAHQYALNPDSSSEFQGPFGAILAAGRMADRFGGVIHHLSSTERRGQAVRQLARLLSRGGRMMVYVWAMEQKKRKFDGQDVLIPWSMQTRQLRKKGKLPKQNALISSSSMSDEESSTPTSVCSQLAPDIRAQKQNLCQDIVNFVTDSKCSRNGLSKHGNQEKITSIFTWLNTHEKRSLFAKSGSDAQINDVIARQNRNTDDVTERRSLASSPATVPRSQSLSERIKAQLFNLISVKPDDQDDCKLANDLLYQQLIDHITNNDAHIFDKPWPPLENQTMDNTFKVREFPLSSFPTVSPLSRFQQSLNRKSQEDSTFLSDDEDEISDEVFENAQLQLGNSKSPEKGKNGHIPGHKKSLMNGHSEPVDGRIKRPDSIKLKPDLTNGHSTENLPAHPDFTLITRQRTNSDPLADTPSALSNGNSGSHSNLSPWIQDGYSADESSISSSFADLTVEKNHRHMHHTRHLKRKPKPHLHHFLAHKAHSFDAPATRKEKPRNGLKMAASLDTDSDITRENENKMAAVYHRYYHVFKQGELVSLLETYAPDCKIVDVYFDHGNWCVIAEKQ